MNNTTTSLTDTLMKRFNVGMIEILEVMENTFSKLTHTVGGKEIVMYEDLVQAMSVIKNTVLEYDYEPDKED